MSLKKRIRSFAGASIYRMNACSADVYAFDLTTDGKWRGGWDWLNMLSDKEAQWLLDLKTGEFRKNRTRAGGNL